MTSHEKLKLMVSQGRITQGDVSRWICPECLTELGPMRQPFALERAAVNHCTGHLAFNEPKRADETVDSSSRVQATDARLKF